MVATTGTELYVFLGRKPVEAHQTTEPFFLLKATKRVRPTAWSPQLELTMLRMTRSPSTMGLEVRPP